MQEQSTVDAKPSGEQAYEVLHHLANILQVVCAPPAGCPTGGGVVPPGEDR